MTAFYKTSISSILFFLTLLPFSLSAQFRGGSNDGVSFNVGSNQPLGRNIFKGGNDDGNDVFVTSNQPLGRNIFRGGNDDGINVFLISNQPLGRNIFKGGNDDGNAVFITSNQPLGRNIFRGGNDDGTDVTVAANQPLGRNIYTGGTNDGWAMGFVSNTPLPITLSDFNGRWQQDDALLIWQTSSELNTAHFELERSWDGINFTKIQSVNAAGQSNSIRNYQYADLSIRKLLPSMVNTIYYRLRSVDKNGAATYSGIVLLKVTAVSDIDYAVFPNPAKDFVTITASQLPAVDNTFIRLADASGKVLLLQKMVSSRQQISVSAFTTGTYFLQLVTKDKVVYTQKIIIQK